MGYVYGIFLMGAGIYAILIGNDLLPSKNKNANEEKEEGGNKHRIQYTIAGLILIYFGGSNLYSVLFL